MFRDLLAAEFAPFGQLSDTQLNQLEAHFRLLTSWNPKLNLTRITDLSEAVRFHYAESLFLAASLPAVAMSIGDVGSGGGFPGIPVAIFRPDCRVTLIESHQRKAVFLREASRSLSNVRVLARRGQDLTDHYDLIISRAVTPAEVLSLRISSKFSLLIGSSDANDLDGRATPLPWGNSRVLFHVEREKETHP